jgi:hypothetical protein
MCMQVADKVFICAWTGQAADEMQMHPPVNLLLRLLVDLAPSVVIPVAPQAASLFDESQKPFQSDVGFIEDFSVQMRTSANTAVSV